MASGIGRPASWAAAMAVVLLAGACAPEPILIEDVSPDGAAVPLNDPDPSYSGSGLMAAVDGSGPVGVSGPPTSWSTLNGSEWVEHLAAVDDDGRVHVFYRIGSQTWRAVDVTEKTGRTTAVMEPASWQMPEGGALDEKIGLVTSQGDLIQFRWRSGSDWRADDLTADVGRKVEGPVSAWTTTVAGGSTIEVIAARGVNAQLLVLHRGAGGSWSVVDVTAQTGMQIAAGPTGWSTPTGHAIAVASTVGDLLFFSASTPGTWTATNVSNRVRTPGGPPVRIASRTAAWTENGGARIAARAPNDDLLLFSEDPIESTWRVTNVTQQSGRTVASAPTAWRVGAGTTRRDHLAASDNNDRLVAFARGSGTGTWQAVDVTTRTGRNTRLRPTAWITPDRMPTLENLAATNPAGHLASFSRDDTHDWTGQDVSVVAGGRVVYAASHKAGVWRSDDYGRFWTQLGRPQPGQGASWPGTLDVAVILDVAVSPEDPNIVLVGTGSDHRDPSRAGLYRSTDGGRTWQRVQTFIRGTETLPATQVVFAPGDSNLVVAAGGSAIVASPDAGATWDTLLALAARDPVWHVAVSEADARGRRSVAALGPESLWFSPRMARTASGFDTAWALDTTSILGAGLPATNTRTTQGVGSHAMAFVPGSRARLLVANPNRRGQRGPIYYSSGFANGATGVVNATGSLWDVDLSAIDAVADTVGSQWRAVPIPATYSGAGSSGVAYVYTHRTPDGFLVFFANRSTVHVSEGVAAAATDWLRLDGRNAAASTSGNTSLVHVDPHDLLVSPDMRIRVGPADAQAPFDQHAGLQSCDGGRLWMAHDGGVTRSEDCGDSWTVAEDGLSTLNFINVAVSPRSSQDDVQPIQGSYLYGGTTHNDQSFSRDGGQTWYQTRWGCGDCDAWFTDPAQPSHVLRFMPRSEQFDLFVDSLGGPDALQDPRVRVPYPDYVRPFAISFKVLEGYRPIVYTLPGEANIDGGDFITIRVEADTVAGSLVPGDRVLLRASGTFVSDTGSAVWSAVSGSAGTASDLPATADVVQASGGHDRPVYFLGDGQRVWRSHRDATGTVDQWTTVVPNTTTDTADVAGDALRFFVNPYDTLDIYVAGSDFVRHSVDGGATFPVDRPLDDALTEDGAFLRIRRGSSTGAGANTRSAQFFDAGLTLLVAAAGAGSGESEHTGDEFILNDMVFDRDSSRRFAVGIAGVFFSRDGVDWSRLVDSRATPGRPRAAFYDKVSDPSDPALYVAYHGRGILRIHPIP